MDWIFDPQAWAALAALTALEVVLGIDNIIFISILAGRLPQAQQARGRTIGLLVAMLGRVALLIGIVWVAALVEPWFSVFGEEISGRDLILLLGGLFLLAKSTLEIHHEIEGGHDVAEARPVVTFRAVIFQIVLLDLVFSLDSVITAVGMAEQLAVMILAVVIAVGVMMLAAGRVSAFIARHPTLKMLALSFLLLIGVSLVAESLEFHLPKGYVYFAMAFSVFVEALNLRVSAKRRAAREKRGAAPPPAG
ncbi:MAG TPA: TerC family protein [Planctomycetota bacterium]